MPWTGPVFPSLPGITYPVKRGANWSSVKQDALSGKRTRYSLYTYPTYSYELPFNFLRSDSVYGEWQQLQGFVNSVNGSVQLFGFLDPDDNTVTAQEFGVGNGAITGPYQLVRALGGFVEPVFLLQAQPTISVAGTPTTAFTVDNYARVTFTSAPANGAALSWSGSYYMPCRFDDDSTDFSKFMTKLYELKKLAFSSEKLP